MTLVCWVCGLAVIGSIAYYGLMKQLFQRAGTFSAGKSINQAIQMRTENSAENQPDFLQTHISCKRKYALVRCIF